MAITITILKDITPPGMSTFYTGTARMDYDAKSPKKKKYHQIVFQQDPKRYGNVGDKAWGFNHEELLALERDGFVRINRGTKEQSPTKRRYDRLAQQRHRDSKQSYVTEIENLRVLLAWEAGELSEGQTAKHLGLERIELRDMRIKALRQGVEQFEATQRTNTPKAAQPSPIK